MIRSIVFYHEFSATNALQVKGQGNAGERRLKFRILKSKEKIDTTSHYVVILCYNASIMRKVQN